MSDFDYERSDVHLRYDEARGLPPATLALWMETLARHLAGLRVESIVDVGCGTGRFTFALARRFAARVYGVDPSTKMLGVARESQRRAGEESADAHLRGANVEFIEGSAERLPLDACAADVLFLSMVYHHVGDKRAACAEFRRVLRPEGRVCVRTATRERVGSYLWLDFFPEARAVELGRLPSAAELQATFGRGGFRLVAREAVRQIFARDLREYADKIGLRAISSLRAIPDEAFARGLARLREHCAARDEGRAVEEELELFVFGRDG